MLQIYPAVAVHYIVDIVGGQLETPDNNGVSNNNRAGNWSMNINCFFPPLFSSLTSFFQRPALLHRRMGKLVFNFQQIHVMDARW